ncbi:Secreted protein [Pseudomonas sp. IT-P258]
MVRAVASGAAGGTDAVSGPRHQRSGCRGDSHRLPAGRSAGARRPAGSGKSRPGSVSHLITATAQAVTLGLSVGLHHRRVWLVGGGSWIESTLLHRVLITLVTIPTDLFRRLTVGWIRLHVITTVAGWRLRLANRRFDHDVVLSALLIGVIGTCRQEQQRPTDPHLLGVIRQVPDTNPPRWLHHHVTRAQRAIPVATGIVIIHATVRHAVVALGEAVDHMAGTILGTRPPAVAAPTRTPLPMRVIGRRAYVAIPVLVVIVATRLILVVTVRRLPGLAHGVGAWLDRHVSGRHLRRRRRRAHPAVVVRCWAALPLVIVLTLILAAVLVLAIVVVLRTGLILLLAVLRMWLVAAMALVIALMPTLAVLPAIMATILLLISHRLRRDTDTQQTNTGQTPDARFHAVPHCG